MIKKVAQNKKQKITIDKLAQMVEKLSKTIEKGFTNLEIKFKKDFDEKIDKLARITADSFSKVDERFNKVDERFDKVENAITDLRIEFNDLKSDVNKKIEYGIDRMLVMADDMTKKFSHWNEENTFGAGIESRQDDELKDHEKRIVKIEQKIEV